MIRDHFKIAFRILKKNSLFSSINIVGLAISMSVGILMILLISELNSFDNFHEEKDNIYRVTTSRTFAGKRKYFAASSYYIGNQIKQQVPDVANVAIVGGRMLADLKTIEKDISIEGYYASSSFFDVFSFKLIKGNPQTALKNPNGIILTSSTAFKLFGNEDPMGQIIAIKGNNNFQNGIITGIIEDPPINSHMRFEALVSLKTLDNNIKDLGSDFKNDPGNFYFGYVYLILKDKAKKEEVEYAMNQLMSDYNAKNNKEVIHQLQPLSSFVTSDLFINRTGPSFSQRKIYIMMGLTFIVLISACFNYTNLSLARALRRSKEIGIRKVVGANRYQVFLQFIIEAIILSLIALIGGLIVFLLIKPGFLNLPNSTARGYQLFSLQMNYSLLLYFILFAIGIGFIAGFIPAIYLSKFKFSTIFNDASKVKIFSGIGLRRILTVFQFTLSIGLIMCAVLVRNQYDFALNYNLGYNTENIVNVKIKGDYAELLENEYAQMSAVVKTSKSSVILGEGSATMGIVATEDKSIETKILVNEVDNNYLDMHEFDILAGSGFLTPLSEGEPKYIIVNETLVKALALGSPEESIGKNIWRNENKLQILGVVGDFVNVSLNLSYANAFAFVQTNKIDHYLTLGVKIEGKDTHATLVELEEHYKKTRRFASF